MRSLCIQYGLLHSSTAILRKGCWINSMRVALTALMLAGLAANTVYAQEKAAAPGKPQAQEKPAANVVQGIPMMPLVPAMRATTQSGPWIHLNDLVLAKIDIDKEKGPQLVALVEHMDTEEREVQFTMMKAENRTRTVTITGQDGKEKQVEQEYTVTVPVTEKRTIQMQVPSGKTRPMPFPVALIKFYHLDGSPMETDEATKKLQKMCPVFLVRNRQVEIKKIDEIYQRSINPECVIAVVSPDEAPLQPAILPK